MQKSNAKIKAFRAGLRVRECKSEEFILYKLTTILV